MNLSTIEAKPVQGSTAARAHRCCPVCDADRPHPLFDNAMAAIDDFDFSYPVVTCGACGMVYASRTLDEAAMARYYRDLSKYDLPMTPASGNEASGFDVHRARCASAFTRRLVDDRARVLDVGCSTGLYLTELSASGLTRLHGVEPSPNAAASARLVHGLDVVVGNAEDFDGYAGFDVIALLAVLEHLRSPRLFFEAVARRMKTGALLVVEVPDADRFGDYAMPGIATEPFGEFSIEHVNFFGTSDLRRLAREAGLAFVAFQHIDYLNGCAGVFAAFRKQDARLEPAPRGGARTSVERYVRRSAEAMRAVDAHLVDAGLDRGSCLVYGAGSHTARLLLQSVLRDATVVAAFDRNPNLIGRRIGGATIEPPADIARYPDVSVVVSTFNAMDAIANTISMLSQNPIVTLYPSP